MRALLYMKIIVGVLFLLMVIATINTLLGD